MGVCSFQNRSINCKWRVVVVVVVAVAVVVVVESPEIMTK